VSYQLKGFISWIELILEGYVFAVRIGLEISHNDQRFGVIQDHLSWLGSGPLILIEFNIGSHSEFHCWKVIC
jgi:hypothetical protein